MTCCTASTTVGIAGIGRRGNQDIVQEEAIREASCLIDQGLLRTNFIIPDMHCASCIGAIERGLRKLPYVVDVRANLTNRTVAVSWDPVAGTGLNVARAIDRLGFAHTLEDNEYVKSDQLAVKGKRLLLSIAVAGFAAANIMLLSVAVWSGADAETTQLFHLISGFIAIPAIAYAGQPFFHSAMGALAARRLNMDVPISLAILLATGMSLYESLNGGSEAYFDAAVTLTFFLLIGRYLDHLMREKARNAVQRLARLSAKGAMRIEADGGTQYLALADIVPGMILRVKPGEHFPVNGTIVAGTSEVDRSLVTGEADAVACHEGVEIEAGVLNLTGVIDMRATSTSETSFLAEIRKLMEAAENGRGKYVRVADRMAQIYAPSVHLLALATFVGWMIVTSGNWHASIYTAIAVLIVTCPCALGLAVPVVHVVGAGRLLREGILIRDGSAFERLSTVDTVVFDKTGTLTLGKPRVIETAGYRSDDAKFIHSLASRSSHPAAKAIMRHLKEQQDVKMEVTEIPGFGIEANLKGRRMRLGRPTWVAEIAAEGTRFEVHKGTAFVREGQPLTSFILKDEMRPEAIEAVNTLAGRRLNLEILSGDHGSSVSDISDRVHISAYRSDVLPIDKINRIRELQARGHKVMMVGDGLNDAPALAAADVSIAPASASDIGRLAADLVFTRPSLNAVCIAHSVARSTSRLIKQNFAIALLYNSVAVPLAMMGLVTPLIAAIAMSTSSIAVILNSMRLNLHREPAVQFNGAAALQRQPAIFRAGGGLSGKHLEAVT